MNRNRDLIFLFLLMSVTFVGITAAALVFRQELFVVVPLYVSLAVMLLQARANRYTFLLGGLNSLLYACVNFYMGLYASGMNVLLVSFPFQIVTFYRWGKRPYGNSTMLKTLGMKKRLILALVFAVCWLLLWRILSLFNGSYLLFDNTLSLIGFLSTVLSMLSYLDFAYLQVVSLVVNIALYLTMMREHPIQLTYLIYSLYALICSVRSLLRMRRLYQEQQIGRQAGSPVADETGR